MQLQQLKTRKDRQRENDSENSMLKVLQGVQHQTRTATAAT
jgi:hypothetical protein